MLKIYGFKKTTLIDYPGHIACTVFTHGCTLRCPFCHNPQLVIEKPDNDNVLLPDKLLEFLKRRKGKLEGIVFSGGEPLVWIKELRPLIHSIKDLGYLVKIDTNGTLPEALRIVLKEKLADFVAMDFKITPQKYNLMKASPKKVHAVMNSLEQLKNGSIEYEIRTTLVPGIHDAMILKEMMPFISKVPRYVLQNFEPNGTVDPAFKKTKSFSRESMREFLKIARSFNPSSTVRIPD